MTRGVLPLTIKVPPPPPDPDAPPDPKFANFLSFANSDMAFSGNHLFMGNFNGFTTYDVESGKNPKLLASVVCPGGQGDMSVHGNLLFMSVEQTRGRLDCGTQGIQGKVSAERFRGVRIFDISDLKKPRQVAAIQTCRGSHTHIGRARLAQAPRLARLQGTLRPVRARTARLPAPDRGRAHERHSLRFHLGQPSVENGLLHLELGDAVAQEPTGLLGPLEDRDPVPGSGQLLAGRQAGRPRAHDGDRAAGPGRR